MKQPVPQCAIGAAFLAAGTYCIVGYTVRLRTLTVPGTWACYVL